MKKTRGKMNLRGKVIAIGALMLLMVTTVFGATKTEVFINGKEQTIPSSMGEVFVDNQARAQVPLRFISERLGHKVDWDEKKQQVAIDGKAIILNIGDKNIKVNGKTVVMDTSPVTIKGRTYVPVRFIAEGLGHQVEYKNISGKNVIFITTSGEVPEVPSVPVEDKDKDKDSVDGDYKPGDVPTYTHKETTGGYDEETKHWITNASVGSNTRNTKTRSPGTSFHDDLGHLNSMVGNTGYGFAADGLLTIGSKNTHNEVDRGNLQTAVSIGHTPGTDQRSVGVGGFIPSSRKNPDSGGVGQHNIIIESIKYFSKSADDGLAIVSYFSKFVDKDEYPPMGRPMTFGSTTVEFDKIGIGWGFYVRFQE